jgi:hypothetical protein
MNEQGEAQIGPCTATLPRSIVHWEQYYIYKYSTELLAMNEQYSNKITYISNLH